MWGLYRWRLKRRRRALALAWCGDPLLADRLLAESAADSGRGGAVERYRRMAACWLAQATDPVNTGAEPVTPGDDPSHDGTGSRVRHCVAGMPLVQRMTLGLIDVARLGYRETAEVMGVSLFEVQYQIVMARRTLLDQLSAPQAETADPASAARFESC